MDEDALVTSEKIMQGLYRMISPSGEFMYLVEGRERAALIDTGTGLGNLLDALDKVSSKPVIPLLSHGHSDHSGGVSWFDEIWMHPADHPIRRSHKLTSEWEAYWRRTFSREGFEALAPTDRAPALDPVSHDLLPGMVIDLGGVTVEVLDAHGHTAGSLAFLIPEKRVLFTGDACSPNTWLFLSQLDEATRGRYDQVLVSHQVTEPDPGLLPQTIAILDTILSGKCDNFAMPALGETIVLARRRRSREDKYRGNVIYDTARDPRR